MSSLFKSTAHAQQYAMFRPVYPSALYSKINSSCRCAKSLAIDVGCGTGQATVALAEYFDKVIGIDPSEAQLQYASRHDRVAYQVGQETNFPAESGTVAAVSAAQAAHWFDIPKFYKEVDRVLQPGGCLALWTYVNLVIPEDETLSKMVLKTLYQDTIGRKYWDERRVLVEDRYRDIPLMADEYPNYTGERIMTGYDIQREMAKDELIGYLRSWSGYVSYCESNGILQNSEEDPVKPIQEYLYSQTKYEDRGIPVIFPMTILLSVKGYR